MVTVSEQHDDECPRCRLRRALEQHLVLGTPGSVEQHPIADQIAADRYLASKQAMSRRNRGLRISRIVPPGTGGTA